MDEVGRARKLLATATLMLAAFAALGLLLPWAEAGQPGGLSHDVGPFVAPTLSNGLAYVQGLVALAGALGLVVVSALYLSKRIRRAVFVVFGVVLALVSIGAVGAFWISVVNIPDPIYHLDRQFNDPRIHAGAGWYMTLACLAGALLSLMAFALESVGFRVVHDDRARAGGSLVPSYLRFRIDREGTRGSHTPAA